MSVYDETPVYEESTPKRVGRTITLPNVNKGHLLVGAGAFILLAQVVPDWLFIPLFLISLGAYFLRQDRRKLMDEKLTKGHFLFGIGTFILLANIIPGNILLPLALITIGMYFMRRPGSVATE